MSSTVAFAAFLLSAIALASAISMPFTDCGSKNVKEVSIVQCRGSPCILKHHQSVQIKAIFDSKISAKTVYSTINGRVRGRDLPFPEEGGEACAFKKLSPACPLTSGKQYTYSTSLVVPKVIPATTMTVTYKVINEKQDVIACAQIAVDIRKK